MKRLLLTFLFLAGCNEHHRTGQEVSAASASPEAIEAFRTTLYNYGATQGCVSCHADSVSPLWMSADVNTAYAFARPYLQPSNPAVSHFASYAGNGHCNSSICSGGANVNTVKGLLSQWAAVELSVGSGVADSEATLPNPPFVTASLPVPSPLPLLTATNPAILRFDLSQLTPPVPALAGAILEIQIRAYSAGGDEYKVYNPRLLGNSGPVTIEGIHVYVRPAAETGLGVEDVGQGLVWTTLSTQLAPSTLPNPLPTGPLTIGIPLSTLPIALSAQSSADVITVGFAAIR